MKNEFPVKRIHSFPCPYTSLIWGYAFESQIIIVTRADGKLCVSHLLFCVLLLNCNFIHINIVLYPLGSCQRQTSFISWPGWMRQRLKVEQMCVFVEIDFVFCLNFQSSLSLSLINAEESWVRRVDVGKQYDGVFSSQYILHLVVHYLLVRVLD